MRKSAHVANASGQTARAYVRTGGVNRNFCLSPGDVQKVESKERAYFSVTIDGMTQQMELPPDASLLIETGGPQGWYLARSRLSAQTSTGM